MRVFGTHTKRCGCLRFVFCSRHTSFCQPYAPLNQCVDGSLIELLLDCNTHTHTHTHTQTPSPALRFLERAVSARVPPPRWTHCHVNGGVVLITQLEPQGRCFTRTACPLSASYSRFSEPFRHARICDWNKLIIIRQSRERVQIQPYHDLLQIVKSLCKFWAWSVQKCGNA